MEYFAFQWHITNSCDQHCEHCYIFSEGHTKLVEMPFGRAQQVVADCVEKCRRMERQPYFYITGSDPILHSCFWDILALLRERNISFTILGNPFHLTDEGCRRLREHGCDKYQLSIYGRRETHDAIRNPGSFDTTVEKIAVIHRGGIRCAVMTTVSGTNIREIPDIIDLFVAHNVDIFAFGRYCPTSLGKSTHIEPLEYRHFLGCIGQKFEQYKDSGTMFNLKDHLWTLFLYEKGLFKIPEGLDNDTIYDGCHCGDCHMTILPTGRVMACRRFESPVGNVFREPIHDIYNSERMNAYRRENSRNASVANCCASAGDVLP